MKLTRIFPTHTRRVQAGEFSLNFYADGTGLFVMACPNRNSECGIGIIRGKPDEILHRHGWDGNADEPTITPSIGCDNAPRCGWHGHITGGVRNP